MMKEKLKYCLETVLLVLMPFAIITIVFGLTVYSDEKVNINNQSAVE